MTDATAVPPASETPPVAQRKDMSLEHKIALIVCLAIATIIPSYLIWGLIERGAAKHGTAGIHKELGAAAVRLQPHSGRAISPYS